MLICNNFKKKYFRCNDYHVNGTNGTAEYYCKYDYNGQGFEYQVDYRESNRDF